MQKTQGTPPLPPSQKAGFEPAGSATGRAVRMARNLSVVTIAQPLAEPNAPEGAPKAPETAPQDFPLLTKYYLNAE